MTTLIPKFEQPFSGAVNLPINKKLEQTLNVLDFGADPTGVADSTTAIQAAITAAGAGGTIIIPAGTFLLSATLHGLASQQFKGAGVNSSVLYRTADYGDTLSFTNAGGALISGLWFKQGDLPAAGFTTLTNKVTTGSHINFTDGQGVIVEKCWFWRMQFGINIQKGSLYRLDKCNFNLVWNSFHVAGQEGIASVFVGSTAYTQLVDITDCYFGGSDSGAQTVTITTTDNGAQSVNFTSTNAGGQYGVLVYTCEGLLINNSYLGGNVVNNISLQPNAILGQVRITDNFFDGAGYNAPVINIQPQIDGQYPTTVDISNNCFNGELNAFQSIASYNPHGSQPTLVNFQISGNTMSNGLGSGIFLRQAQGGVITGNTITAYNSRNLTFGADVNYCVGIYVTNSNGVYIADNLVGGGINSASPSSGYCYQGIVIAGSNIETTSKNNYYNGVGIGGLKVGRIDKVIIISTSGTNYTMTGTEELLIINNSGSSSIQITPPTSVPPGYTFILKDGSGTAAAHNIQFVGTVDAATNPVYSTNYFSKTFTWNGTVWNLIASS